MAAQRKHKELPENRKAEEKNSPGEGSNKKEWQAKGHKD